MHNFEVKRKRNEPIESLLSRFTKKYIKSGILREIREDQTHLTKSQKKRKKQQWRQ